MVKEGLLSNYFTCTGKLAGSSNKRTTPGGIPLVDMLLAVLVEAPWKQKRFSNIKLTCFGDNVNKLARIKTGDELTVEGFLEQKGIKKDSEVRLIVTKIKKEK